MARKNITRPALPGQSRSTACQRSARCLRLDGHRGGHRQSLTAKPSPAPVKAAVKRDDFVVKGTEVASADVYTVLAEEPKAPKVVKAARKSPKALPACRVAKAGIKCDRLSGHKAHGLRHRFVGIVTILPEGESVKVGISGPVGQHKNARRPKAAPVGRNDVTIAEALAR